jgi:hypothetical protein
MNATINGIEVTLRDNPGFTYSFYDSIDPAKVKGSRSTTIEIVADNAARLALGGPNMAEQPTRTHILNIGEEGLTYWRSEITVEEYTQDTIRCSAVGGNASWMEGAKALRLRDIPLGISPEITDGYQRGTWYTDEEVLYFPLIDYGTLEGRAANYNVPAVDLRPAVRVWHLLVQGFNKLGHPIRATGRFATWWKKLVLPNVQDDIFASAQDMADRTAQAFVTNPTVEVVASSGWTYIPILDGVASDPSNLYNAGTYQYTPNVNMYLRPVVTCDISISPGTGGMFFYHRRGGALLSQIHIDPTGQDGSGNRLFQLVDFELPSIVCGDGFDNRFELHFVSMSGATVAINDLQVKWQPTQIPYAMGITIDQATAAPKGWTLADLVKGIEAIGNLKFITDEGTGEVRVMHYDDLFAPTSEGIDMQDRANEPITKVVPAVPSRYVFTYADDRNDRDVLNNNSVLKFDKWGCGQAVLGGIGEPVEVETKFAATAMGNSLEGAVFIPWIRHDDAPYQGKKLEMVPRILIADGIVPAAWTHEGNVLDVQPKCFFVWPDERVLSLDFGLNDWFGTAVPGTITTHYGGYLRSVKEGLILRVPLRLYDHELMGFDWRRPVYVDAGFGPSWYYILSVEQKQFGEEGYTDCELIQV